MSNDLLSYAQPSTPASTRFNILALTARYIMRSFAEFTDAVGPTFKKPQKRSV